MRFRVIFLQSADMKKEGAANEALPSVVKVNDAGSRIEKAARLTERYIVSSMEETMYLPLAFSIVKRYFLFLLVLNTST